MPQAKREGSRSGSSSSRSSTAKRSAVGSSRSASRATGTGSSSGRSGSTGSRSSGSSAASGSTPASGAAAAVDPRVEALAQRLRKLNERIIDAGKGAGDATLTSYEKALKSIASAVEKGPGRSDVEWISTLATVQAKFIRDVTAAWTSAARDMFK